MQFPVFILILACLLCGIYGQNCGPNEDISCPEEIASTFLSIQNSVAKRTLTTRGLLDIVFVIDEGALRTAHHYWTTQLLHILSEIFVIAPEYTRAAVVTYSSSARVIVSLQSNANICSFTSSINNTTFRAGSSYLSTGLAEAVNQLNSGRAGATKLTILITNGAWGNMGSHPQGYVNTLRNLGYFSAVILKHMDRDIGLIKDVIFDYFVSFFGSKKLGFTADMTPEYLRELHGIVAHNKASGTDWPLDINVDKSFCTAAGRTCAVSDVCVCEARTIAKEYICIGKDVDPPEVVACQGPKSPVLVRDTNRTSAEVTWTKPLFSDNTGVVSTVSDQLPGFYHVGSQYTVTSTATDSNKNSATCSFTFVVSR